MYVCVCHGFTDGQVRDLTAQGCRSIAEVYRCLSGGAPPQCGKCVPFVRQMLQAPSAKVEAAVELAAGIAPAYGAAAE
jgi:bacterioferritin-associated ferredoxin